ncbi:response regulator [Candidatus Falkowbacteria bacterium]|nr:response regulator [Candidatus Falkowbacteria bacterium]
MDKNIFIVEDDANLSSGLAAQFSMAGFKVETSHNEEEIEDLVGSIKKFNTDVIVIDLILPKLDGFEIIKAIRSDDELSDLYIFVFTDVSDEDSKARGLKLGANQYFIRQDFSVPEFADKVKRILENKEAIRPSDEF